MAKVIWHENAVDVFFMGYMSSAKKPFYDLKTSSGITTLT